MYDWYRCSCLGFPLTSPKSGVRGGAEGLRSRRKATWKKQVTFGLFMVVGWSIYYLKSICGVEGLTERDEVSFLVLELWIMYLYSLTSSVYLDAARTPASNPSSPKLSREDKWQFQVLECLRNVAARSWGSPTIRAWRYHIGTRRIFNNKRILW